MINKIKLATIIFSVICMATYACGGSEEDVTDLPYALDLNDNHFLYVKGYLCKKGILSLATNPDRLMFNDIVIYPYKSDEPDEKLIKYIEEKYRNIPFVIELQQQGTSLNDAINTCRVHRYAAEDSLSAYYLEYLGGKLSMDECNSRFSSILRKYPFNKIFEYARINKDGYEIKMFAYTSAYQVILSEAFSNDSTKKILSIKESAIRVAADIIGYFLNRKHTWCLYVISGNGNTCILSGMSAQSGISQIHQSLEHDKYVDGPVPKRMIQEILECTILPERR